MEDVYEPILCEGGQKTLQETTVQIGIDTGKNKIPTMLIWKASAELGHSWLRELAEEEKYVWKISPLSYLICYTESSSSNQLKHRASLGEVPVHNTLMK